MKIVYPQARHFHLCQSNKCSTFSYDPNNSRLKSLELFRISSSSVNILEFLEIAFVFIVDDQILQFVHLKIIRNCSSYKLYKYMAHWNQSINESCLPLGRNYPMLNWIVLGRKVKLERSHSYGEKVWNWGKPNNVFKEKIQYPVCWLQLIHAFSLSSCNM